jgi:3-oxoacyl-[acyl-carrier-protein] synthase III
MADMTQAYITGTGAFLPGEPVGNAELAARFGDGTTRDTVVRDRVLAANEIRTRHYAEPGMLNEELAARAVERALQDRGLQTKQIGMLATGTTQGDLRVPGFASMVHGRLGGGPCELLSAGGVCASGMAALKAAVSAVRLGEHPVAVATGSELASRWLLAGPATTADTSFLRWTLSDGAGAVVVEPEPRPDGLSLRVDWIHLVSHAHDHPVCMSAGPDTSLRQDMSALPALVDLGVAEFCALVKAGRIDPDTEHILCHYSAGHFRHKLLARLREEGYDPADKQLFSNLETVGNIGAASIFVMLDEVRPTLAPGERVLLVVPESGRFSLAFAQLTCVGPDRHPSPAELAASPIQHPDLAQVWSELERSLARVPVVRRIEDGTATLEDYRRLLLNLRQQVIDGGRWISLAAANFSADLFWLRSAAIQHAAAEHRDFLLLERDYASVGGDHAAIVAAAPNIGSAALSAFVFHRAGQPDPVDLLGAMFVIEGLGLVKAARWADQLQRTLNLNEDQVSFLRYHAEGDEEHFQLLQDALRLLPDDTLPRIVKTARVVARLYALQLEELDNA